MRKFFKIAGAILGIILLVVICFILYIYIDGIPKYIPGNITMKVEVTPERVAKGQKIASMLCIECHKNKDGILTGKYLNELPKEFGTINSRNITNDPTIGIGSWTDGELYYLLRTGIAKDGHYIPPYMVKFPLAADEDIKSVIAFLRSNEKCVQANGEEPVPSSPSLLVKFLSHVAWKPLPLIGKEIPLPDSNNIIAHGKYLFTAMYGCFMCHSKDFKTMNVMEPENLKVFAEVEIT
jgi:cytochrome c2